MDAKARLCIAEAQTGIALGEDEVRWVQGHCSKLGRIDVVYRRKPSGLRDHGGTRTWDYCEGFVLEGDKPDFDPKFPFAKSHFDKAHEAMRPQYERFFASDDPWNDARATMTEVDLPPHTLAPTDEPALRTRHDRSKIYPQPSAESAVRPGRTPLRPSESAWYGRAVKGVVIAAGLAGVTVGTYLIAEHLRRSRDRAPRSQSR